MISSYKNQISNKLKALVVYSPQNTNIYVVGSLRVSRELSYNAKLSDIDLLIVPVCDSLDDYVAHFKQLINIADKLNLPSDQLVEFFILPSSIVDIYTTCLSVISGDSKLQDEDLVYKAKDHGADQPQEQLVPSLKARKGLYVAASEKFRGDYARLMPVADTGRARKTAKCLLRGLKLIVCAHTDEDSLMKMEQRLTSVDTFSQMRPILSELVKDTDFTIDDIWQDTLDGHAVDDWSEWMMAQEAVAKQLLGHRFDMDNADVRFYDGLYQARELLVAGIKNVLNEKRLDYQKEYMETFANDTASVIVKLALSGVECLIDFEDTATPSIVSDSSVLLIEYLKGDLVSLRHMAACVVLLEYAFKQSLIIAK